MSRGSSARISQDDRLDLVFRALSDRTRREMLRRLSEGPTTVTALSAPFDMSLPAVSKHLKVLEQAGLISRSVEGRVHHCALRAEPLEDIEQWLSEYRGFWEGTLDALAEYAEDDEGETD